MAESDLRKRRTAKPQDAKDVKDKAFPNGKPKAYPLRTAAVLTALLGTLWLAWKLYPTVRTRLAPAPSSGAGSAALPGVRFGYLAPEDRPVSSPDELHVSADEERREAVREAYDWSWKAYEKCAFGDDEFHPLSCSGSNLTAAGGIGYTIVDALDSLLLMGFDDEFERAATWCRDHLTFERDAVFNTFETTIRVLGGLLSAHYMASVNPKPAISAYAPMLAERAADLGDRLLGAFDTRSGLPTSGINLAMRDGVPDPDNRGLVSLAEAATLQLEFKYLTEITGDTTYWRKAERVMEIIYNQVSDGVVPIFLNAETGSFVLSEIRLGSRGDSYYEYLLKQYLQTNRTETVYRDMYDQAMAGVKKLLVSRTKRSGLLFTQELHPARHPQDGSQTWQVSPKQDHLVCFLGGSLILGVTEGNTRHLDWAALDARDLEDLMVGRGLIETCMATHNTPTGLAPEIAFFYHPEEENAEKADWYIKPNAPIDGRYILRPETVESLFLAYRQTGDERYREWGWRIFQSLQKHCRVKTGGYAIIKDVQVVPAEQEDRMESFWLSETLKYLYLLFSDSSVIPLDKHVFNTEAHILPVFEPAQLTEFSTS